MAVGINGAAAGIARGWLDTLGATSFSVPGGFVQLHTGDPGPLGLAANKSTVHTQGSDQALKSLTWAAATTTSNTTTKAISNAPQWASWGGANNEVVSHVSIWSAASAGTFLFSAALAQSRTINTGDTVNLTSLSISITPIAI
jgi:hypothetical protein